MSRYRFPPLERAAYVPAADTLLLADLHLGRAETSRVEAPIDDGSDAQNRLASLLAQTEPDTVVVAGDLLHAFDRVPLRVARDLEASSRPLLRPARRWSSRQVITIRCSSQCSTAKRVLNTDSQTARRSSVTATKNPQFTMTSSVTSSATTIPHSQSTAESTLRSLRSRRLRRRGRARTPRVHATRRRRDGQPDARSRLPVAAGDRRGRVLPGGLG